MLSKSERNPHTLHLKTDFEYPEFSRPPSCAETLPPCPEPCFKILLFGSCSVMALPVNRISGSRSESELADLFAQAGCQRTVRHGGPGSIGGPDF